MVYSCLFASEGDQAAQRYGVDRVSARTLDFLVSLAERCPSTDQGVDGAWQLSACSGKHGEPAGAAHARLGGRWLVASPFAATASAELFHGPDPVRASLSDSRALH